MHPTPTHPSPRMAPSCQNDPVPTGCKLLMVSRVQNHLPLGPMEGEVFAGHRAG